MLLPWQGVFVQRWDDTNPICFVAGCCSCSLAVGSAGLEQPQLPGDFVVVPTAAGAEAWREAA